MQKQPIVCKFGGTSMADANAIKRVAEIIRADSRRRYVVVSAAGKRYKTDEKITDLLYRTYDEIAQTGSVGECFKKVANRYRQIVADLGIQLDIEQILAYTVREMETRQSPDFCASRGEYLAAIIVAKYLEFPFLDAADIIKFDPSGRYDSEYSNDISATKLNELTYAVIPGFYGSKADGSIVTFSRGGSDITGSIISRAAKASVYENWTDVDGFMTADPRIVENPKKIEMLTYAELRELSYMGASVLHAEAIFPLRNHKIPVNIKNTFHPDALGTMIYAYSDGHTPASVVTGIAGKKDFSVVFIEKTNMNAEIGFARKVLSVLEYYGISFEHMPSGIDTLSLVVESAQLRGKKQRVLDDIKHAINADRIMLTDNLALVSVVGHGMCENIGTATRLCAAISDAGINLRMLDQGSSELSIFVAVDNKDYEATIQALYNEFIR